MDSTREYPAGYQSRTRAAYAPAVEPVAALDRLLGTGGQLGFQLLGALGLLNVASTVIGEAAHPSAGATTHGLAELAFSLSMIKIGEVIGDRAKERAAARAQAAQMGADSASPRPTLSDLQGAPQPTAADVHAEFSQPDLEGDYGWPMRDSDY